MISTVTIKNSAAGACPVACGDKRIAWIDCAKGLTMLLVILGHTGSFSGNAFERLLRGSIFSFHMPLFFILSCVTFQLSKDNDQFVKKTEKAWKHLILTALALYGLRILVNVVHNFRSIDWKNYIVEKINVSVYASGGEVSVSEAVIPAFGMMWFFVVLFLGRTLFDYLHLKLSRRRFAVIICMLCITGVILGGGGTVAAAFV